jgi:hypothetical protein
MVFSDTTNLTGMIQECERGLFSSDYGRISGNTTILKEFTSYMKQGIDEVTKKKLQADNTWDFDDSEHTDFPIATTDIVASQEDYSLAVTHLIVKRVEIKDEAGNWKKLTPIDNREIKDAIDEFRDSSSIPDYYDVYQNSIRLFPTASYNSTDGLKVYFQRPMDYFETTDTTKAPGFASIFHRLVPMWANYFYAAYHQMPIADSIRAEISLKERDLKAFFRGRHEDMPKRIIPHYKSSR